MAPKVKTHVKQSEIATVIGVSEAAVSKMVKNGMPTDSIEAAKLWRDSRPNRRLGKRERESILHSIKPKASKKSQVDNIKAVEDEGYDESMVAQACVVTKSAFEAYNSAIENGNPVLVAGAIKNWGEAGKVAGIVRERFLDLQEREKKLIGIDEVMCGLAGEVAEWRRMLLSLGARLTGRITPEAAQIVDAAVDEIMKRTDGLEPMGKAKFHEGK
jgi:hypothetical protein